MERPVASESISGERLAVWTVNGLLIYPDTERLRGETIGQRITRKCRCTDKVGGRVG